MAENNFRADRLESAMHSYGIEFDESIKWDNEKMIKRLGDFFIDLEPTRYSWGARYVQSLNTVMLCKHMKDDIDKFPISPLESDEYVAETKLNGMRCVLVYSPDTGFEFFTRRESVSNYLNGNITDKFLFIEKGIILADGYTTKECKIERIDDTNGYITLTEGKYHEIKRLFGARSNKIIELQRISFSDIYLNNLELGKYRHLTDDEEKIFTSNN
jgi:hypothetical protein